MALKRAFSISGLVTEEEMDKQAPATASAGPVQEAPKDLPDLDEAKTGSERMTALQAHAAASGVNFTWAEFGVGAQTDLEDDGVYAKLRQHITGEDSDGALSGEITHEGDDAPTLPGTEGDAHRDPAAA
jgi:hypothetical protein